MDECTRHAVQFFEKEIKTYTALSLFLTKKGTRDMYAWARKVS